MLTRGNITVRNFVVRCCDYGLIQMTENVYLYVGKCIDFVISFFYRASACYACRARRCFSKSVRLSVCHNLLEILLSSPAETRATFISGKPISSPSPVESTSHSVSQRLCHVIFAISLVSRNDFCNFSPLQSEMIAYIYGIKSVTSS